jgi:predicted DNA-binding transcriptional regulator YafY
MLQLLSLLQTHRYWPGAELADRLTVSPRTLRRDVDRLRALGYPVEAQRGVDGGYQLTAGAAVPPLVLDDEEAVALAVGIQSAVQGGTITGISESSVRVLAKLIQVMPARLRRRVDALAAMTVPAMWGGPAPVVDSLVLTAVAQAGRDHERLEFAYADRAGTRTERLVEPHRLVLLGHRWYLVAFDLIRHDWRSFRVDRISDARSTGVPFGPREPPGGDAAEFVRSGIDSVPASFTVEAVVHAPSSVVQARVGRWGAVEEIDDGTCRLRMTADSLDWPALALAVTRADFEILTPPEFVEHLEEWAGRLERAVTAHPRQDRAGLHPADAGRAPAGSGVSE